MYCSKYERDDSNEQLIHQFQDENAKKLNIANTLKNVFTGSKLFLFVVSIAIVVQIFYIPTRGAVDAVYENYWNNLTKCMNVTED